MTSKQILKKRIDRIELMKESLKINDCDHKGYIKMYFNAPEQLQNLNPPMFEQIQQIDNELEASY